MNKQFAYFVGLLAILAASSFMIVTAQNATLNNTTLNNTTSSNLSLQYSAMNNTDLNTTTPEETEPRNNASINASTELSAAQLKSSNRTAYITDSVENKKVFQINANGKNNSAYKISTPIKPLKDVSTLGYIIQGTPHGYV